MHEFPITLVLETSTPHGSIGLHTANAPWQGELFYSDRGHNCEIFLPLQRLSTIAKPGCIQQIIVGTGPGSYSGTRVGIAVAQGLSVVHQCPIIGIPSLLGLPSARSKSRCLAIGDARRGDWWWAWINDGKMPSPPTMGTIDELNAQIASAERIVSLESIQQPLLQGIVIQEKPDAQSLWQAWTECSENEKGFYESQILQPLYLKPPHITAAKAVPPRLQTSST